MKYYIQHLQEANDFEARFKRSNLSFKYDLLAHEFSRESKYPMIILHLRPSGYDLPECFENGEFKPENISLDSYFSVCVTDYNVISDTLTKDQQRDLLRVMHDNRSYTKNYYADYRKHHLARLKNILTQRLHTAEILRKHITRLKGEQYYNDFVKSIKSEFNQKIEEIHNAFTPAERY